MKGSQRASSSKYYYKSSIDTPNKTSGSNCLEPGPSDNKLPKSSLWPGFFLSTFSIFDTYNESKGSGKKAPSRGHGWTAVLKRIMNGGSMRRIQERVLGFNRTGVTLSAGDIWLLGVCYKICLEDPAGDLAQSNGFSAFVEDFSSRILMTYRKGFPAIGPSKYTSDVNWGCMVRSSQMLVAQALLCHQLGRSWRKSPNKPLDQDFLEILQLFGDSEASVFSIHNLLHAGKAYQLAPGSWVGPYAMCRTWETLGRCKEVTELGHMSLPIAVYVVSGDEDGERGGAPVLCIEDVSKCCSEFSRGQADWAPILLLVPLVLGLDKVNPRYIPLLGLTFTFPQSLGILGGRPGVSTYIVGVQDERAFYLDPHEVQQVVEITRDNVEADTSSYHCSVIRQISLDSIDSSLAIGFYCRDRDDFDNFCSRASKLADQSNGAPLFTITQTCSLPKPVSHQDMLFNNDGVQREKSYDVVTTSGTEGAQEDDWQLL